MSWAKLRKRVRAGTSGICRTGNSGLSRVRLHKCVRAGTMFDLVTSFLTRAGGLGYDSFIFVAKEATTPKQFIQVELL